MNEAPRCDYVKIAQVVEDSSVEQMLIGVESVCDTAVQTLFAFLSIEKPTVGPALRIGGNK